MCHEKILPFARILPANRYPPSENKLKSLLPVKNDRGHHHCLFYLSAPQMYLLLTSKLENTSLFQLPLNMYCKTFLAVYTMKMVSNETNYAYQILQKYYCFEYLNKQSDYLVATQTTSEIP